MAAVRVILDRFLDLAVWIKFRIAGLIASAQDPPTSTSVGASWAQSTGNRDRRGATQVNSIAV